MSKKGQTSGLPKAPPPDAGKSGKKQPRLIKEYKTKAERDSAIQRWLIIGTGIVIGVAVVLLAMTFAVASLAMSSPRRTERHFEGRAAAWAYPAVGGAVIVLVVGFALTAAGAEFSPLAVLSWFLVPAAVIAVGALARVITPLPGDPALTWFPSPQPGEPGGPATASGDDPPAAVVSPRRRAAIAAWLSATVVAGAGIGLLRGALPAYLLRVEGAPYGSYVLLALGVAVGLSAAVAYFGTALFERALDLPYRSRVVATAAVGATVMASGICLAVRPDHAPKFGGSAGVISLGFALLAVVVGGAAWLSKRCPPWEASRHLWLGQRPSLGLLLLGVWLLSSVTGGPVGYYDARVLPEAAPATPSQAPAVEGDADEGAPAVDAHSDLASPVKRWIEASTASAATCGRTASVTVGDQTGTVGVVPMVFVVAPGGGIRAAYWTASAMDQFFSDPECASSLFAFSGVSGGSVGGTVRLLTAPGEPSRPHIGAMAQDVALATNLAGLFFRDTPQPFAPASDGWPDRAELMERAWVDAARPVLAPNGAEDEASRERTIADVGAAWRAGDEWPADAADRPAVLLNASSVLDGCVAVTATWRDVAAGSATSCFDAQDGGGGPLAATHETRALVDGDAGEGDAVSRIPAITGALLSARFPYVSPSGAVRDAAGDSGASSASSDVLYLIDGGVYENTGLLSALSLWSAVEPLVAEHNRTQGVGGTYVEPWLLMLSSGYEERPEERRRRAPPRSSPWCRPG